MHRRSRLAECMPHSCNGTGPVAARVAGHGTVAFGAWGAAGKEGQNGKCSSFAMVGLLAVLPTWRLQLKAWQERCKDGAASSHEKSVSLQADARVCTHRLFAVLPHVVLQVPSHRVRGKRTVCSTVSSAAQAAACHMSVVQHGLVLARTCKVHKKGTNKGKKYQRHVEREIEVYGKQTHYVSIMLFVRKCHGGLSVVALPPCPAAVKEAQVESHGEADAASGNEDLTRSSRMSAVGDRGAWSVSVERWMICMHIPCRSWRSSSCPRLPRRTVSVMSQFPSLSWHDRQPCRRVRTSCEIFAVSGCSGPQGDSSGGRENISGRDVLPGNA